MANNELLVLVASLSCDCRYDGDTSARTEELQKQLYRYVPVDITGEVFKKSFFEFLYSHFLT